MKNIITGIACFLVLSVFIVQFTSNQVTHSRMLFVETQVNSAMEEAKEEGCITAEISQNLKEAISNKVKCSAADIRITGTTSPVRRGEKIEYSVIYPLKGVIGAGNILGLSEQENSLTHNLSGVVISEYIAR